MIQRLLGIAMLVVCVASPAAAADKPGEADYHAGARSYAVGEYGQALELFKNAYKASGQPALLFNVAQCERKLGKNAEAAATLRNYLQLAPEAGDRAEIESTIITLDKLVEEDKKKRDAPPAASVVPVIPGSGDAQPADKPARKPLYKQAWLWAVVGGVVVVGAVAAGIGVAASSGDPTIPDATRFTVSFK